jgi:hypothetical protein
VRVRAAQAAVQERLRERGRMPLRRPVTSLDVPLAAGAAHPAPTPRRIMLMLRRCARDA